MLYLIFFYSTLFYKKILLTEDANHYLVKIKGTIAERFRS